jgi:hypothetical protein
MGATALRSEPAGARILLDEIDRGLTPMKVERLKRGVHSVLLSLEGYIPRQDTLNVFPEQMDTLDVVLTPLPATLVISSFPESSQVIIDTTAFDQLTPLKIQLEAGQHRLSIRRNGYGQAETLLTLKPAAVHDVTIHLTSMENIVASGSLRVMADPWAEVSIDGKNMGSTRTQNMFDKIPVGKHAVKLFHPDYPVYEGSVFIRKSVEETISHDFTLMGWVNISCIDENQNPIFGEIKIDGKSYGMTPKVIRNLPIGSHGIEMNAEGYLPESRSVTIQVEKGERVQFILRRKP